MRDLKFEESNLSFSAVMVTSLAMQHSRYYTTTVPAKIGPMQDVAGCFIVNGTEPYQTFRSDEWPTDTAGTSRRLLLVVGLRSSPTERRQ